MSTTGRVRPGNLPAELTSFVGRKPESAEIKRLMTDARLVTLIGAGGTGKTRLAVRVAAEVRRAFPDGAWFVDFTRLQGPVLITTEAHDPDPLASLLAVALGLRRQDAGSPVRLVTDYLAGRKALLVLDNCEQVIAACAVLADRLLRACPQVRLLATSREPLLISGEVLITVPPLPAPAPGQRVELADLAGYDAVELFLARARSVAPGFALTAGNQAAVAELCHRLDGLPLAIELAAARTRVLEPQQILDRLGDRFALLSRGSRSVPVRQQTLRACVDWSFELCAKQERLLWARLSVFAGWCEYDAVEAVCTGESLPAGDLLDVLAGLVDKSILVRDGSGGGVVRYRMLETIRAYGHEQLIEAGEQPELRRRHLQWCRRLVDSAGAEWFGDRQPYWWDRLARGHADLSAAMEHCLSEPGQAGAALRLAVAVPRTYWVTWGRYGEARGWLARALAQAIDAPAALRAGAQGLAGYFAVMQGEFAAAARLLDEAYDLARGVDAPNESALVVYCRGVAAMFRGEPAAAPDLLGRALEQVAAAPEPDLDVRLRTLFALGVVAERTGDPSLADACYREMLAVTEPRGEVFYRSMALWMAALGAWRQGRFAQAAATAREGLRITRAHGFHYWFSIAMSLEALAWIAGGQRQHRRAATLLGAVDALFSDLGTAVATYQNLIADHEACERQARDALGAAVFAAAFHRGRTMPFDAALGYALDEHPQPEPARPRTEQTPLTRREQQIAGLIAEGLSNREIAARLVISPRTAESHVEHILAKLGFGSRSQVAAWMAGQQPGTEEPSGAG